MAKNKKVDPNAGIHSCEKCKSFHPHVRRLHEARLLGYERTQSPFVLKTLQEFERNMPFIHDNAVKAESHRK